MTQTAAQRDATYEASVENAVEKLACNFITNRDEAFKILRKHGLYGSGRFLNDVLDSYATLTGNMLNKPHNEREKLKALKWAHSASADDVEAYLELQIQAGGEDRTDEKVWAAYDLYRQGKWHGNRVKLEISFDTIFTPGKPELDPFDVNPAVEILKREQVTTRAEAYKILSDKASLFTRWDKDFFKLVLYVYENEENIKLKPTITVEYASELHAEVHDWDANEMRKQIETCTQTKDADAKFWIGWEFHKQGKWPEIERSEFFKLFQVIAEKETTQKANPEMNASKTPKHEIGY